MIYKGFTLDKFQEDSINAIEQNHSVVVSAPTGSGKTLIADYIIEKSLEKGVKVIYTAPIKALSNQKYKEFTAQFGKDAIGLLTGDIVINPEAPIRIMTTEIYRNMALTHDPMLDELSYVIFDEIHFINDYERGYVWEESIIFSKPKVRFLCLSATIPNAKQFASWINAIKKHTVETIIHTRRHVPLHRYFFDTELGITTLEEIKDVINIPSYRHVRGRQRQRQPNVAPPSHIELVSEIQDKLPCFFFNFSRQGCQDSALELARARIFEAKPEIISFVCSRFDETSPEIRNLKSTRLLREILPYGIAFHHAGLIPFVKALVEELFSMGMIKVLYTTETFAVGINMPAKTVCFKSLRKFDGASFRLLYSKEYFQIAGRAGRRGIDKEGFVYAMIDRRDFDYELLKKRTTADTEPIRSQFRLSVNTVLNIIKRHTHEEIEKILRMSFYTYQRGSYTNIKNSFNRIQKKLVAMGYLNEGRLTEKGEFSSRIYADEILIGEIFATEFIKGLDEFQIMMIIACLAYEPREKTEFGVLYPSKPLNGLKQKLKDNVFLRREKRFNYLDELTAMVDPCYHGKEIFEIMKNTNFLEGDVIRFFRQMLDRLGQIKNATKDPELKQMLIGCHNLIISSLSDIDTI